MGGALGDRRHPGFCAWSWHCNWLQEPVDLDTVMTLAIEFGTFSFMLIYIMIIATNNPTSSKHLGGCYLGLFLLVFFTIAPSGVDEGEDEGLDYCIVTLSLHSLSQLLLLSD